MTAHALRKWWPLAAVVVLLALAAFAAAHSETRLTEVARGPEPARSIATPSEPEETDFRTAPPRDPVNLPGWVGTLVGVLCVGFVLAAVLAGIGFALRDVLRRRPGPAAAAADPVRRGAAADEVLAAVDAGLTALDAADGDPRRVVIACWVRLEQAAAAAGTPRLAADTSTDLVTRLLAGHAVSADVLAGFAAVYRAARYATHAVDDRMRTQAREALHRLRTELTTVAAAGDR
jgi:hypothetical protein